MNAFLGQSALLGCLLSLAVNIGLLFGIDVAGRFPVAWFLDCGLFMLLIAVAATWIADARGPQARTAMPVWVLVVGACLLAYALLDAAWFAWHALQDGDPELGGGKYLQVEQGTAYRIVALPKYEELRSDAMRVLSEHWMLLYFAVFAWFSHGRQGPKTLSS